MSRLSRARLLLGSTATRATLSRAGAATATLALGDGVTVHLGGLVRGSLRSSASSTKWSGAAWVEALQPLSTRWQAETSPLIALVPPWGSAAPLHPQGSAGLPLPSCPEALWVWGD